MTAHHITILLHYKRSLLTGPPRLNELQDPTKLISVSDAAISHFKPAVVAFKIADRLAGLRETRSGPDHPYRAVNHIVCAATSIVPGAGAVREGPRLRSR